MKKSMMAMAIGLTIGLGVVGNAKAEERTWEWSPVGIGLAAPIQVPYVASDVYGLRLGGFFGYNHDMFGLDCGVAAVCSGEFRGLQLSGLSWTEGNVYGLQLGSFANIVNGQTYAMQVGFLNTVWGDACGVDIAAVNYTTDFRGIEVGGVINWNILASYGLEIGLINANQDEFTGCAIGGLVNYSDKFTGFGVGFVNVAYEVTGCQLGVFNACDRLHGVQFGLVNMICEAKLPIMVIANAAF